MPNRVQDCELDAVRRAVHGAWRDLRAAAPLWMTLDDLMQDVMLRYLRMRRRHGAPSYPKAYAFRIAKARASDARRSKDGRYASRYAAARVESLALGGIEPEPWELAAVREEAARVSVALQRIEPKSADALARIYFTGQGLRSEVMKQRAARGRYAMAGELATMGAA